MRPLACRLYSEDWITLIMLVHIIRSSTTLIHGLVIGVVMAINEIDQCTTVRSLGQIRQKSTKEKERRYVFQWL
jgi:energy-converting hydrogenase Eha subunit B